MTFPTYVYCTKVHGFIIQEVIYLGKHNYKNATFLLMN